MAWFFPLIDSFLARVRLVLEYLSVYLKNQVPYAAVYNYLLNILHPKLYARCYGHFLVLKQQG